jgi:hypothetical protein
MQLEKSLKIPNIAMIPIKRKKRIINMMQNSSVELSWQKKSLSCARTYRITNTTQIHLERLHDIDIIL